MKCFWCDVSLVEKRLYRPKINDFVTYYQCPDCDMGYIPYNECLIMAPAPRIPSDGGYYLEQMYKKSITTFRGGSENKGNYPDPKKEKLKKPLPSDRG